jgi:hypothetical protein
MPYITLKGCWCDNIVLNVHAQTKDKDEVIKDSFYEELEQIFDQFPTYLLVLFVPTGTKGLNNFTIVEVSIAVKFFTETGLLALCSNPQPGELQ